MLVWYQVILIHYVITVNFYASMMAVAVILDVHADQAVNTKCQ